MTPIAVYGATGRTGKVVIQALARLGWPIVLCGRDRGRLLALAQRCPGAVTCQVARSGCPEELLSAFDGVAVVVQCASLDAEAALSVARCCIAVGASYVDVCADAAIHAGLERDLAGAAERARLILCPGLAPIGGALAEWLVLAALRRTLGAPTAIEILYCSTALPWSAGSLFSALRMLLGAPSLEMCSAEFPPPFAREVALSFPLGSGRLGPRFPDVAIRTYVALAPRWMGSSTIATMLSRAHGLVTYAGALEPMVDQLANLLVVADRSRRSVADDALWKNTFAIAARVTSEGRQTGLSIVGAEPYLLTAAIVELAVRALLDRQATKELPGGFVGASELVLPEPALEWLAANHELCMFTLERGQSENVGAE